MSIAAFIERQRVIRHAVLCALYRARMEGEDIYLSAVLMELGHEMGECRFALDYLAEAQCIYANGLKSRITAKGIDRYEEDLR